MAGNTDFFSFYQQLGLDPGCSPDELKNAYRRRVSALHPDRRAGRAGDPAAAADLQELTTAYTAAMRFQSRYGRLPGAQPKRDAGPPPRTRTATQTVRARGGALGRIALAAMVLAALGWIAWDDPSTSDGDRGWSGNPAPVDLPGSNPKLPSSVDTQRLELGLDVETVRAIEGSPVMESAERWDYGPSWIQFDHGVVSDWYSSKLRPLHVASTQPRMDASR